tara:strand:+ start:664 stop:1092 length:429 start_codon:yes stop_codon:yes gene_type:complete
MTWTYSNDPANSTRDELRLLVGDTATGDQLLSDEEIAYYLSLNSDDALASAPSACEGVAAKFSRQANTSNQGLSVAASERAKAYLRLADELRDRAATLAEVFAGGLTIDGKEALADDVDATQPAFAIGLDDFGSRRPGWASL